MERESSRMLEHIANIGIPCSLWIVPGNIRGVLNDDICLHAWVPKLIPNYHAVIKAVHFAQPMKTRYGSVASAGEPEEGILKLGGALA